MSNGLWGTLPIQGTQFAKDWDALYTFLFWVCAFFFVIIVVPAIFFIVKYRERPGIKPASHIEHNSILEFTWTVIPTILALIIFAWGWEVYKKTTQIPPNAMTVRVVAKSWNWSFQYDDGRIVQTDMYVPENTPVRLLITSEKNDVLHSFFVPNFRIKKDAVPGMFTTTWFESGMSGQHLIFCTEYCGASHSNMMGRVVVLSKDEFEKWKWGKDVQLPPPVGPEFLNWDQQASAEVDLRKDAHAKGLNQLAQQGAQVVQSMGCVSCHSSDGSARIGPSYHKIFGREAVLADGSKVQVDENWIREKIETPHKRTLAGYQVGLMPSYKGLMTDSEIFAVIEYLKSLN